MLGLLFSMWLRSSVLTHIEPPFFSTATLDATGHIWLAEISIYNFTITYRSGQNDTDAAGLSRKTHNEETKIFFPKVLEVTCK